MAKILTVAQLGNPVLRKKALPVEHIWDESIQELIANLMETLIAGNGVGIAAPQVGESCRLLIVASRPTSRYPQAPEMPPTVMINPHILHHSTSLVKDWEGCLSVPGIRGLVPRYDQIQVEYTCPEGKLHQLEMIDFVARIFQHEYDHLEGIVFVDHVENTHEMMTEQEYQRQIVGQV